MPSEGGPLSEEWKKDTAALIKADHERRGLIYITYGEEAKKRLKESHGG